MSEVLKFLPRKEQKNVLPDGTIILIEIEDPLELDTSFGDVDEHEAEHAVVAVRNGTPIIEATTIAEGNSAGHVLLSRPDPIATATSHGRAGRAGDHMLVASLGYNFASLGETAHAIKNKNRKAVRAVAGALAKKRWLSGVDVQDIVNQVDNGERIRVTVVTPHGKKEVLHKRVRAGEKVTIGVESLKGENEKKKKPRAHLPEGELSATDLPKGDFKTEDDFAKRAAA